VKERGKVDIYTKYPTNKLIRMGTNYQKREKEIMRTSKRLEDAFKKDLNHTIILCCSIESEKEKKQVE